LAYDGNILLDQTILTQFANEIYLDDACILKDLKMLTDMGIKINRCGDEHKLDLKSVDLDRLKFLTKYHDLKINPNSPGPLIDSIICNDPNRTKFFWKLVQ